MPHALRFEGLTLTVENVARSVAFYGGVLGLDVAYNSDPAFALTPIVHEKSVGERLAVS